MCWAVFLVEKKLSTVGECISIFLKINFRILKFLKNEIQLDSFEVCNFVEFIKLRQLDIGHFERDLCLKDDRVEQRI